VNNQSGGVYIPGNIDEVFGDIIGGNKITNRITINIVNPIGKIVEAEIPPGPGMYVDRKHQFSISWPKDSDWIPSSKMGEYQLSQLGVTASQEFRLLGLLKQEFQATFGLFKIQRPQGACVGYVIINIYPKTFGIPNMSVLVGLMALSTFQGVRDSGGEVISQNVLPWDGRSWRPPSETPNHPEVIYWQIPNDHQVIARIIRGNRRVYSISSPIYPPISAFDNLREDTNAILNSFHKLS
jgi:hypothetical protein